MLITPDSVKAFLPVSARLAVNITGSTYFINCKSNI